MDLKHTLLTAATAPDLARSLIATMTERDEAQAAQALVVERAADAVLPADDPGVWRGSWFQPALQEAQARVLALADPTGVKLLAELRARAEKADEHRLGRQAMHRRAQRAEGKSLRSIALLDVIIARIKDVVPVLPTLPSPYPLSLHTLYHQLHAVRRHAKNSSGSAAMIQWSYYHEFWKKAEARAEAAEAQLAEAQKREATENARADAAEALVAGLRAGLLSVCEYEPDERDNPLVVIMRMAGLARATLDWLDETNPDELERRAQDFEATAHFGLAAQFRDRARELRAAMTPTDPQVRAVSEADEHRRME